METQLQAEMCRWQDKYDFQPDASVKNDTFIKSSVDKDLIPGSKTRFW